MANIYISTTVVDTATIAIIKVIITAIITAITDHTRAVIYYQR